MSPSRLPLQALLVAFGLLGSSLAWAADRDSWYEGSVRDLYLPGSQFQSRALRDLCFQMLSVQDQLPCNPAFLAQGRSSVFSTHLLFGHNISHFEQMDRVLREQVDEELAEYLFSSQQVLRMEALIEASYRAPLWGLSYSPYRFVYYSSLRNRAHPTLSLFALQEQSLRLQLASYIESDVSFGLSLRYTQRRFVRRTFSLFELMAEGGQELLRPKEQNIFYFEPSLSWDQPELSWRPQVSVSLTELGFADRYWEDLEIRPRAQVGFSLRPPLRYGVLEWGVNWTTGSETSPSGQGLRTGLAYSLGILQLVTAVGQDRLTGGFLLRHEGLRAGVTLESERGAGPGSPHASTVYSFLGIEI